jgi:hypothetical protein
MHLRHRTGIPASAIIAVPHDAWLESAELQEHSGGERRQSSLTIRLLGAYHDGFIELHYPQVFAYTFDMQDSGAGRRDWRYDELRLSDTEHLIHEIEWAHSRTTCRCLIEASDVTHRWIPL